MPTLIASLGLTAPSFAFAAIAAGVFGAVIGSFLNVVAYRLPRGESLVFPASHCTSCDTPIKSYDNVPVVGWLVLRGRCRACRAGISARYPIVEALTGALAVTVVVVVDTPVAALSIDTWAPEMAAPDTSVTLPAIVPPTI